MVLPSLTTESVTADLHATFQLGGADRFVLFLPHFEI